MEEQNVITLLDEFGNEVRFDHLLTFDYLGKQYIALLPLDDVEDVGEDEVVLLSLAEDKKTYKPIENPVLLDEVFDVFSELFEEMLDDEDDGLEID